MSLTALRTEAFRFAQPGAAELVEGRGRAVAAALVLLEEVEPLDRDEEPGVARVAQVDHLARDAAVLDRHEAAEEADAVLAVDDEVPRLQVAQVGEERLGGGLAARGGGAGLAEDVDGREDEEPARTEEEARRRAAVDEAARSRRERRGRVSVGAGEGDLVLGEDPREVLALPLRRRRQDDGEAVAPRPLDLARDVGEAVLEGEDRLRPDEDRLARGHRRREGDEGAPPHEVRPSGRRPPRAGSGRGATSLLPHLARSRGGGGPRRGRAPRPRSRGRRRRGRRSGRGRGSTRASRRRGGAGGAPRGRRSSGGVGVPRDRRLVVLRPAGGEDRERPLAALRACRASPSSAGGGRAASVPVERCVSGSNVRTDSTSSNPSSIRTGSARFGGKTSTRPPRTARSPHSVTRSARAYPSATSAGDEAADVDALSRRHDEAPLPDVVGPREDPEERAGRDDEEVDVPLGEPGERPVLLAPHLQRRRDPLVRRQRRRREERDALRAEDRRRVAVEGRGVPLVRADDGPLQPERRRRGAEEVGQESGRGADERHPSRGILEDPGLEARQKARHGGRGGDLLEEGVPPALHGRDYREPPSDRRVRREIVY